MITGPLRLAFLARSISWFSSRLVRVVMPIMALQNMNVVTGRKSHSIVEPVGSDERMRCGRPFVRAWNLRWFAAEVVAEKAARG